jgi:uncharacterized protein (DUF1800 family)
MALSPEDARQALMAMHRFGLGAKTGGLTMALARDPRAALLEELAAPARVLVNDPRVMTTSAALARHFEEAEVEREMRMATRDDQREMRAARGRSGDLPAPAPGMMTDGQEMASSTPSKSAPSKPLPVLPPAPLQIEQSIFRSEAMVRLAKVTEPNVGMAERLVLFWSNHFCVSVAKGQIVRATAGALEREVIRPNVLGRFSDMLMATIKHPAMLTYLDNRQSVGPGSRAGQNRRLGLNENLGREILELHTLGVKGGYTQADVTALAKIITGWTFVGQAEKQGPAGTFMFTPNRHEPGVQTLLGKIYSQGDVSQGEAALLDLARHPATAQHIALKLARHFVADAPPLVLVDKLASVFRKTEGDLAEVTRALVNSDEAWKGGLTKIRTPYEWLSATVRFAGLPKEPGQIMQPLVALGQPLWAVPGPNGFPDTVAHWASPESLRARLDMAAAQARRITLDANPSDLAEALFDAALSADTRQAIRRAESKPQGFALLLMSPEFQRR